MRMRLPKVSGFVVAALVLGLIAIIADRLVARPGDDGDWNPRVVQRQQLRFLGAYITDYGRQHGRPAFHLDSVEAHLDSATRARFHDYRTDIWGNPVHYWWDETRFHLSSGAGLAPRQRERKEDSIAAAWKALGRAVDGWEHVGAIQRRISINEEYWWPEEARGRKNSLGQFTRAAAVQMPVIVR